MRRKQLKKGESGTLLMSKVRKDWRNEIRNTNKRKKMGSCC
jgi:hypothetical protein